MSAHDPKEGAREKAGWGLPIPAPAGARSADAVADNLFALPKGKPAEADPVASLFQQDRPLPAPSIADLQSEAELTRWRAGGRTSLFEESVPDPPPASANPKTPARATNAAKAMSMPPPPVPPSARRSTQPASASLSPVPSPLPVSLSMAPLVALADSVHPDDPPARRRRVERGAKKGVLAAVGVAAVISLGSAGVVLRLIPNPIAPPSQASANAAAARAPVAPVLAAPPMAVPVNGFKPAPLPVAVAPAPTTPVAAADSLPGAPTAAAPAAAAAPALAAVPAAAPAAPAATTPLAKVVAKVEPAPAAAPTDTAEATASSAENQRLISAANKKLAEDDPQGAEALMREALAKDPDDHHAMDVLVRALIDQDRGADAIPYARKMVRRRSKRVAYRLLLGDVLLMTGDQNGARREWKAALDLEPNDREVRLRLGI